eukprot:scaffold7078_cov148-Skeletonema_marinoi.AAC.8
MLVTHSIDESTVNQDPIESRAKLPHLLMNQPHHWYSHQPNIIGYLAPLRTLLHLKHRSSSSSMLLLLDINAFIKRSPSESESHYNIIFIVKLLSSS